MFSLSQAAGAKQEIKKKRKIITDQTYTYGIRNQQVFLNSVDRQ